MGNKKTIILSVVVFIALVAIVALVLKSRLDSGIVVATPAKTIVSEMPETPAAVSETQSDSEPIVAVAVATPVNSKDESLSAMPNSDEAPKQEVVENAEAIPAQAINISVTDKGFSPNNFTVKSGQKVTLAISAADSNTHVFIFPNASLMGLTTAVLSGETKMITFTAPEAGSFVFRDDIPEYRDNTGTMVVE